MVLSLKPFGCMPSSQSDGVQSAVMNHFKDMIFLPIETSGEGEINAHSRVQMALGEAKAKAKREFQQALESTGLPLDDIRAYVDEHPELQAPVLPGAAPQGRDRHGREFRAARQRPDGQSARQRLRHRPQPVAAGAAAAAEAGDDEHVELLVGMDVGSTTVKAVVVDAATDEILWQDYQRHETKQPEKTLEFLQAARSRDRGISAEQLPRCSSPARAAATLATLIGAKFVQEVNAVSLAVEKLHPEVQLGHRARRPGREDHRLQGPIRRPAARRRSRR